MKGTRRDQDFGFAGSARCQESEIRQSAGETASLGQLPRAANFCLDGKH